MTVTVHLMTVAIALGYIAMCACLALLAGWLLMWFASRPPPPQLEEEPPDLGCHRPPPGWWCSREPGHNGPCAARSKGILR